MNVLANNSEVCDACIEVEEACISIDEKHVEVIDVEEKLDLMDDKESVIGSVSAAEMPIIDALCSDISCISEVEVPYIDAKQMELSFSDDIVHCGMSWCDGLHVHHASSAEVYEVIDGEAAIPCLKEIAYDNEIEDDYKSHVTEAFKSDSCSVLEIETRDISKEFKKVGGWSGFPTFDPEIFAKEDGPSWVVADFSAGFQMDNYEKVLKLLGQSDQSAVIHLCNIPSPPVALDSVPSLPFFENMEQIEAMEHVYLMGNNNENMEIDCAGVLLIPSKAINKSALLDFDPFWQHALASTVQAHIDFMLRKWLFTHSQELTGLVYDVELNRLAYFLCGNSIVGGLTLRAYYGLT